MGGQPGPPGPSRTLELGEACDSPQHGPSSALGGCRSFSSSDLDVDAGFLSPQETLVTHVFNTTLEPETNSTTTTMLRLEKCPYKLPHPPARLPTPNSYCGACLLRHLAFSDSFFPLEVNEKSFLVCSNNSVCRAISALTIQQPGPPAAQQVKTELGLGPDWSHFT